MLSSSFNEGDSNNIHHLQPATTMRLRDEPPAITPPTRPAKKRKTPPTNPSDPPQPHQQQQPLQHVLPPPHALINPHGMPAFSYAPVDYTPGGIPPGMSQGGPQQSSPQPQSPDGGGSSGGRALSNSKRAEQNRKAQRAFRERRDQHVKFLESRSQLLDAALQSADEANRRWEECRALVDQLRVENAALRAALSQASLLPPQNPQPPPTFEEQQNKADKKDGALPSAAEQSSE